MKKIVWIIPIVLLFTVFLLTPAWSMDQTQSGSSMNMPCPKMGQGMGMMHGKGMGGGMMHGKDMMHGKGMMKKGKGMGMMHGKKGRCPNCPMGKSKGKGEMKMGMGGGLMKEFHGWMKRFMAHRSMFDLSADQMNQLDAAMMSHLKSAIQNKADIKIQKVELGQMLRKTPMNLDAVEKQIDRISGLQGKFQMEGVRLYSTVLNILDDGQKTMVKETIGAPFPAPWEKMFPMSGGMDGDSMEGEDEPETDDSQMQAEPPAEMETEEAPESET